MDIEELKKPLNRQHVKTRSKGNFDLSYVEGWHAIAEANRIFGFSGWYRETVYCKEVCRYEMRDKHKVGYEAKVRIVVTHHRTDDENPTVIVREGTGHGSGIAMDLFDAIEGAAKEAETDAMKRALMTFGNPFGLALYDKSQAEVISPKIADAIEFFREKIDEDAIEENYEIVQKAWTHLSTKEGQAVSKGLMTIKAGVSGKKKYSNILNEYLDFKPIEDPDNKRVEL
jgi:recombination DNA repair RAD52 pathway protein